jgi:hypothetical protein
MILISSPYSWSPNLFLPVSFFSTFYLDTCLEVP